MAIKNFIMVGTQRTGSSALAESIGLHPKICCGWEWTQRSPWHAKLSIAKRALSGDFSTLSDHERNHMIEVYSPDKEWIGYRRLFRSSNMWFGHPCIAPGLWVDRLRAHMRWFAQRPDIRIIHIIRRDGVAWLNSKFLSKETKAYTSKQYPEGMKVSIPIVEARKRLIAKDWLDARLATIANTNPYLQVFYEDFSDKQEEIIKDCLKFLDCDPELVMLQKRGLKKQSSGVASDYIANYQELMDALQQEELLFAKLDRF